MVIVETLKFQGVDKIGENGYNDRNDKMDRKEGGLNGKSVT